MRNQEQGAGMRSTPDTLLLYSKACITSAKIHFHIVNQANMAYNNLCVSQNISALCGSRITSHCPALLPIVQGGTPFIVPDILTPILAQSYIDNKYKISSLFIVYRESLRPSYRLILPLCFGLLQALYRVFFPDFL